MESALLAVPLQEALVEELLCCHRILEEFAAFQGESRLLEADAAVVGLHRNQARLLRLVEVTTALGAAEVIDFASLLAMTEEREGHVFIVLDDAVGITLRTNEDHSHRLVPKPSEATPGGGHHIEVLLVAGANQHPFLTNRLEDVIIEFFYVDLFHFIFSFSVLFLLLSKNIKLYGWNCPTRPEGAEAPSLGQRPR